MPPKSGSRRKTAAALTSDLIADDPSNGPSKIWLTAELQFTIAAFQQLIQRLSAQAIAGYLQMQELPQPSRIEALASIQRIACHNQANH